jgi:phosphomevalonate kinase
MNNYQLSGKRCSGKDTVALILKGLLEKKTRICAFALIMKKMYCHDNNRDLERILTDYKYKDENRSGIIAYSKKMKAQYGDMIWCQKLLEDIKDNSYDNHIISDTRLQYEAKFIKDTFPNSKIIRINSTDENKKKRGWIPSDVDNHYTETEIDNYDFDYIIDNDGTLEELKLKIERIVFTDTSIVEYA